jgi:mRNA interferase HicA
MKRTDLIRRFIRNGWWEKRDRGDHTIYTNGTNIESIPRHKEVAERLAQAIIKRRNLK